MLYNVLGSDVIYLYHYNEVPYYVIGKDGNSSSLFTRYRYIHKVQRQIVVLKWHTSRWIFIIDLKKIFKLKLERK